MNAGLVTQTCHIYNTTETRTLSFLLQTPGRSSGYFLDFWSLQRWDHNATCWQSLQSIRYVSPYLKNEPSWFKPETAPTFWSPVLFGMHSPRCKCSAFPLNLSDSIARISKTFVVIKILFFCQVFLQTWFWESLENISLNSVNDQAMITCWGHWVEIYMSS